MIKSFKDFSVYQKALQALIQIYALSKEYPVDERFGLASDTRRSANSICHNIAEGFGRFKPKDKMRFYTYASSSGYEILSQIEVANSLAYIEQGFYLEMTFSYSEIIKELDRLIKSQEKRI